jgi:hypothetical protein
MTLPAASPQITLGLVGFAFVFQCLITAELASTLMVSLALVFPN